MNVNFGLFMAHTPVDEGLSTLLYLLQAESPVGVNHEYREGDMYVSPWRVLEQPYPVLARQKQIMERICSAVLGAPIQISDSWFNIYHSGSALKRHNHFMPGRWPDRQFSLIYYVSRGDDNGTGQLRFYNPDMVINPRNGMLLLFPGSTDHEVLEYTGKSDRIIISCNLERAPPASPVPRPE